MTKRGIAGIRKNHVVQVLVGEPWEEIRVSVKKPGAPKDPDQTRTKAEIVKWITGFCVVVALGYGLYGVVGHDKEVVGRVYDLAEKALFMLIGWAIGTKIPSISQSRSP